MTQDNKTPPEADSHPAAPDFIRDYLQQVPETQRTRARRLVSMLEHLSGAAQTPQPASAPHLRNWQTLDLSGNFLKTAADARRQRRLGRIERQLQDIEPVEALDKIVEHFRQKRRTRLSR